jgi:MFS family permease
LACRDCTKDRPRPVRRAVDYAGPFAGNNLAQLCRDAAARMRLNRLSSAARAVPPGPSAAIAPEGQTAASARGLLANADFRRLWLVGTLTFAVRWLEMLVVGVFVYQHTGSAFDVALMTLLRSLPMTLFGAVIGALAERIQRRQALVAVVLTMLATSVCLAVLAYTGTLAVWHLAVASFCNGAAWAADNPVRRVMIGEVVGHEQMGRAMSVDVGANNATRMLGPIVGGLLLASTGIAGAFSASVVCYAAALAAAMRVSYRNTPITAASGGVLTRIIEGLLLVRNTPKLIGILTITVIYNVFGWPFTSMIPVIGQDNLHLGAGGIGVLASMDGIGAFCGSIALMLWAKPANYARLYVGGVVLYLLLLVVFALVPNVPFAGTALLFTGICNAAFSVMQATLIYLAAPPEMRSRLYGVLSVCIGSAPIGFLCLGLLADAVGATAATAMSGIVGLLVLLATRRWWRQVGIRAPSG